MKILKISLWASFAALLVLYIASRLSYRVAAWSDVRVANPIRQILNGVLGAIKIPIFEILLFLLPIILLILLLKGRVRYMTAILCMLIAAYLITIGIPSAKAPRLLPSITDSEYINATRTAAEKLAKLSYENIFIPQKYSLISSVLTKMGIYAYYAFPTAEVVVNEGLPMPMRPFAQAHELAHLEGIIREDEANLYAFSHLVESGDPCNEFSAYFAAFCSLAAITYTISADEYFTIYSMLPDKVKEYLSDRREFSSYGSGVLGTLSGSLNDAAISVHDSRGSKSYNATAARLADYILKQ